MNMMSYIAIIVCVLLATVATYFGNLQHIVGAPMIGLFIGMIAANIKPAEGDYKKGTVFVAKKFLMAGIILAGATLDFKEILGFGAQALPLILINLCVSFGMAYFVGSKLGVTQNTKTLVGGGTCICGGTAIATLSPIIKAKETEMAYALTAIFLFDIIAALGFPYIAQFLTITPEQFGILAGTAISDTSSVVAAGDTFNKLLGTGAVAASGSLGGDLAVIVKLTRTTMLVPVAIFFTILSIKQTTSQMGATQVASTQQQSLGKVIFKVFPWFILGFLFMAIFNTVGVFPESLAPFFKKGYKFLVTAALVGVGYKINFKDLVTKGVKPVILGGCTWLAVATVSMLYISFIMG